MGSTVFQKPYSSSKNIYSEQFKLLNEIELLEGTLKFWNSKLFMADLQSFSDFAEKVEGDIVLEGLL